MIRFHNTRAIEGRDMARFFAWIVFWVTLVFLFSLQGCTKTKHNPRLSEIVDTSTAQIVYFDGDQAHPLQRISKRANCYTLDGQYDSCQDMLVWPIEFKHLPYQIKCWGNPPQEKLAMLSITAQAPHYVVVQTTALKNHSVTYDEITCEAFDPKEILGFTGK